MLYDWPKCTWPTFLDKVFILQNHILIFNILTTKYLLSYSSELFKHFHFDEFCIKGVHFDAHF
jgi:hypothetical protein